MARLLTTLLGLIGAIPLTAAPVPTHLFPKDPPLYHPTQKGTRWVYASDRTELVFEVMESKKNERTGGTIVAVDQWFGDKRMPYRKLEVSRNGLLMLETTGAALDAPLPLFKCPVRVGADWSRRMSGKEVANHEVRVRVAGIEELEVPAGKFSTVRVEESYTCLGVLGGLPPQFHYTIWYSAEVGVVKTECILFTSVLKSFTPGK